MPGESTDATPSESRPRISWWPHVHPVGLSAGHRDKSPQEHAIVRKTGEISGKVAERYWSRQICAPGASKAGANTVKSLLKRWFFLFFFKKERIRVCCFGCWVGRSLDQSRASRDKKVKTEQRRDQTVTVCEDVDCRGGGNNLILQLNKTYSASPNIISYISCSSGLSNPTGPKC